MDSNSPIYTETINVLNLQNLSEEFTIEIVYIKIPKLYKPFFNFQVDDKKIYYLYAPITNNNELSIYRNLKIANFYKIGLSIYQEFPASIKNKYEDQFHKNNPIDYQEKSLLWLHTFKNPNNYDLINDKINYFFNYSNFFIKPIKKIPSKTIDIVIICDNFFNIKSKRWLKYYHNVSLINKSIKLLLRLKLNITIIDPCNIINKLEGIDYIHDSESICEILEKSKICVVFNKHASFIPYIGNALIRNNCIIMYHSILGEWNLINKYTGSFFSNEKTLVQEINTILEKISSFKPSKWYLKKFNPQKKIELLYSKINSLIN